jgi:membrane protease YdiL (CAAX protease family)
MQHLTENISVPWKGLDVLLFLALWLGTQIACGIIIGIAVLAFPPEQPLESGRGQVAKVMVDPEGKPTGEWVENEEKPSHLIVQLVEYAKGTDYSFIIFLVAFLAVVVAAPLLEELLFRLLFQGWLESKLTQWQVPRAPASGIAIVFVSLIFAAIHMSGDGVLPGLVIFCLMLAIAVMNIVIFGFGVFYLAMIRNVKPLDCIFGTERFFHPQFPLYAGLCVLALLPIYGISWYFDTYLSTMLTAVIPIFIFSLLLGFLYSRTRNLSYCILLHALLNVTSLTIAWLTT